MTEFFTGTAAITIVMALWLLGKRPDKQILQNRDASLIAGINRSQITLRQPQQEPYSLASNEEKWQAPQTAREKYELKVLLRKLMNSGPLDRLKAIEIASQWSNQYALPVLRRGLHDSDSLVIVAAAAAFEQLRGKPMPANTKNQEKSPPRNVALMR